MTQYRVKLSQRVRQYYEIVVDARDLDAARDLAQDTVLADRERYATCTSESGSIGVDSLREMPVGYKPGSFQPCPLCSAENYKCQCPHNE